MAYTKNAFYIFSQANNMNSDIVDYLYSVTPYEVINHKTDWIDTESISNLFKFLRKQCKKIGVSPHARIHWLSEWGNYNPADGYAFERKLWTILLCYCDVKNPLCPEHKVHGNRVYDEDDLVLGILDVLEKMTS